MSVAYATETSYEREPSESIKYVDEPHEIASFARAEVFLLHQLPRVTIDNTYRFNELAAQWQADTRFVSSATQIVLHPAYQQIVGMGPAALPLILRSLQENAQHWFWALRAISGDDPVAPAEVGNVPAMADAWLRWARARQIIE